MTFQIEEREEERTKLREVKLTSRKTKDKQIGKGETPEHDLLFDEKLGGFHCGGGRSEQQSFVRPK